jgi:hypothetical protein
MASATALYSKLDAEFQNFIGRLRSDWSEADRRRGLLLGAGALVWLLVVISLATQLGASHKGRSAARIEVARLQQLIADKTWPDRFAQSEGLKSKLEARLWTAPTQGLAEAGFERLLRDAMAPYGFDKPQIQISWTPATIQSGSNIRQLDRLQRMSAKVTTSYDPNGVVHLMADLAANDKLIVIDQLIARAQRNTRLEFTASTYVRMK